MFFNNAVNVQLTGGVWRKVGGELSLNGACGAADGHNRVVKRDQE